MKNLLRNSRLTLGGVRVAVFFLLATVFLAACSTREKGDQKTYTCSMHPTIISEKPGTCPVCGMALLVREGKENSAEITPSLSKLTHSPNEVIVATVRTSKPEFKSIPLVLEAPGKVTYDPRYKYTIPARISGRLEKVYVKYPYQAINQGQKIAEVYSPELISVQRELLYLIANDSGNSELIGHAKQRLLLLGATRNQVNTLINRGEVANTFEIRSPYDGFVLEGDQNSSGESGIGEGGMPGDDRGTSATYAKGSPSAFLREGDYVTSGQKLFSVANTSSMRIELDIPALQGQRIHLKDKVELILDNAITQDAWIDFIQPFISDGEAFLKIRIYLKPESAIQIGQLVNATIKTAPLEGLWLEREAVLDTGSDKIVFVKDDGTFKPKKISTGMQSGHLIEVKSGITASDEVASNAHYLVDSQSLIKIE